MALTLTELLEKTTFQVDSVEQLSKDALLESMEKYAFARIQGLIKPEDVLTAKQKIRDNFSAENDRPSLGEDPRELKQGHFQKLSVGGAQGYGLYRPRCLRTMYCPIWSEDIYGLREMLRTTCRVRNLVYGLPDMFAIDGTDDEMWTGARLHHYPRGGGFLISHSDIVVPKVQEKKGLPKYYQLIIVLSKRGVDFERGGGFIEREGERYLYESETEYGDIVIYDGRTIHGVEDIDPHLRFRHDSIEGRLVAFVTLYKDMVRGEKI